MKLAQALGILLLSTQNSPVNAQLPNSEVIEDARVYLNRYGLDDYMTLLTQLYQPNLPIQSSPLESVVGITYLPSNDIQIFRHNAEPEWRVLAAKTGKIPLTKVDELMPLSLQQQTVNMACTVGVTRLLLENGLTIRHNYYESDGRYLFHTIVTISHCSQP